MNLSLKIEIFKEGDVYVGSFISGIKYFKLW
jgi:hypothetical protein